MGAHGGRTRERHRAHPPVLRREQRRLPRRRWRAAQAAVVARVEEFYAGDRQLLSHAASGGARLADKLVGAAREAVQQPRPRHVRGVPRARRRAQPEAPRRLEPRDRLPKDRDDAAGVRAIVEGADPGASAVPLGRRPAVVARREARRRMARPARHVHRRARSRLQQEALHALAADLGRAREDAGRPLWQNVSFLVLGCVCLVLGADWLLGSAVSIATKFGVSNYMIGVTVVAFGTSVPELVTSAVAAYRKQTDIAIGNLIGSNVFNILCVVGLTGTIAGMPLPKSVLEFDSWWMLGITFLILPLMVLGGKIHRWKGLLLIIVYFLYLYFLISRS